MCIRDSLQATRTDIAARGLIDDGTAVGMGLANAVSRLKDSKSKMCIRDSVIDDYRGFNFADLQRIVENAK